MAIKRYELNELVTVCEDLFYDYMLKGTNFYAFQDRTYIRVSCNLNPVYMLYDSYNRVLQVNKEKIEDLYKAVQANKMDSSYASLVKEQISFLTHEYETLANLDMHMQKEIYQHEQDLTLSHSVIRFPLNKLLNSLYDDLWLEVLFFDDVCTPKGRMREFMYTPSEYQKQFLKSHTEITHLGLIIPFHTPTAIVIKGNHNGRTPGRVIVLDGKYGDFKNLTLKDIDDLKNNDLKQILQTKIDLDKENLQLIAEEEIRGDVYKLYCDDSYNERIWANSGYYIRYVCSSTGRVYYNQLNLRNLSISDYFNPHDPASYLRAWWNITHLGARVEGKPVISC